MNMNIVDILLLAVLAYCLFAGMHKGFLASGLSLMGFVGSWFGAKAVYERLAQMALSNTTLMAVLNQYLEPENFFASKAQAAMSVSEVVSGGETAIQSAVVTVSEKISVIASAFEANIRNQAFSRLGITNLADYLDQTIWIAIFNVLAFLVAFIVIYALVSLVVNLMDRVICFPVFRMFDWLLGGICGLVRGLVVAVLLLCLVPSLVSLISPEVTAELMGTSTLYSFIKQMDFMGVASTVAQLIG